MMSADQMPRRLSRRQVLRMLVGGTAAGGLGLLAAACGGSASTPQGAAQSTAQPPAQGSGTTTLQFITAAAVGKERDLYTSFINGRNPIWNQYGHERMGHGLSVFSPVSPF